MGAFPRTARRFSHVLLALIATFAVACGGASTGGGTAGTSGGTSGGASGGSQASGVPGGFVHCPQSGDPSKSSDKDTTGEWQYQQQKGGATSGDVEVYAASSSDCEGMPAIRAGSQKIIASAIIGYKDATTAQSAYNGGVFGVSGSSFKAPGATQGSATGFGATSGYAFAGTQGSAMWTSGSHVVAVVGENIPEADFKAYATAVKNKAD